MAEGTGLGLRILVSSHISPTEKPPEMGGGGSDRLLSKIIRQIYKHMRKYENYDKMNRLFIRNLDIFPEVRNYLEIWRGTYLYVLLKVNEVSIGYFRTSLDVVKCG